jgi:hypothetical protein
MTDRILDELVAKGVASDVIVAVAKLIVGHEQVEKRRANNRERMRAVRTRAHTGAHTETQNHGCVREESKKERKLKHTLRVDWKPTDNDRAYARAKGWLEQRIDAEAERFRLYHVDKGDLIKDEHLSWCKWVTSPYRNINNSGGQTHGRRHGSVLDAADRLIEELGGEEAARRYVPGSEGPRPLNLDSGKSPPNLRLIPSR